MSKLRFLRFGRRPSWVTFHELLGYGDGWTIDFPLPADFDPGHSMNAYVAGDAIFPNAKRAEMTDLGEGPVPLTTIVDGVAQIVYKPEGWSVRTPTQMGAGSAAVRRNLGFDVPPPPQASVTISRIVKSPEGVDAPCFLFRPFGQAALLELLSSQPKAPAVPSLQGTPEEVVAALLVFQKELETFTAWTESAFRKAVSNWSHVLVDAPNGSGSIELEFSAENISELFASAPDSAPEDREGALKIGMWLIQRIPEVIAATNSRVEEFAGN